MTFTFKISLLGFEPEIWRIFKAPGDLNFDLFHGAIQIIMGWENSHLYYFENKNIHIKIPMELESYQATTKVVEAHEIKLEEVFKRKGSTMEYFYDFGDEWTHKITALEINKDEEIAIPICLDGANACPPEDCGGTGGYSHFLHALKEENAPEDKDWEYWRENFKPDFFDVENVNKSIRECFRS